MSRLWGYLNSLNPLMWFRPVGFRLYTLAFGCNPNEIEPSDLRQYASLGDFFYRKLKDGVKLIDRALLVGYVQTITLPTDAPSCAGQPRRRQGVASRDHQGVVS